MPIQRTLDITLSLSGIIFTMPILLIIFFIGLGDTGSPIFLQQRVGKNLKYFTLIKFRTMARDTETVGTHLVSESAVTRFGRFLRKTKLDELPQLFNVFWGQMSLVGPRPCLPTQKKLIIERQARGVFTARPGITGLAQIRHIDMSTPRKLARYDELMIKNMDLRFYFMLVTATALGKGRGDRVISQ